MNNQSPWQNAPRKSIVIFLLAVFFVFCTMGFATDIIDMGRQPSGRLAVSVVVSGLFATMYACTGVFLRKKFWNEVATGNGRDFVEAKLAELQPGQPTVNQFGEPIQLLADQAQLGLDGVVAHVTSTFAHVPNTSNSQ